MFKTTGIARHRSPWIEARPCSFADDSEFYGRHAEHLITEFSERRTKVANDLLLP
jgi:hypothetical protein